MISLVFPRKLMALFLRLDRPETRVRLQCYFLGSRHFAETEQNDPEPSHGALRRSNCFSADVPIRYPGSRVDQRGE